MNRSLSIVVRIACRGIRPSILFWSLLIANFSGCSDLDVAKWREEVELADGQIVVITRRETRKKSGFPLSIRGPVVKRELILPWGRPSWVEKDFAYPLALEIRDERYFLAVNIQSRKLCAKYDDPPSSVVYLEWKINSWVRIAREEFPANGKANLLLNPWGRASQDDVDGLVRNKDKHLILADNRNVNRPLKEVLSKYEIDACQMFKRN